MAVANWLPTHCVLTWATPPMPLAWQPSAVALHNLNTARVDRYARPVHEAMGIQFVRTFAGLLHDDELSPKAFRHLVRNIGELSG